MCASIAGYFEVITQYLHTSKRMRNTATALPLLKLNISYIYLTHFKKVYFTRALHRSGRHARGSHSLRHLLQNKFYSNLPRLNRYYNTGYFRVKRLERRPRFSAGLSPSPAKIYSHVKDIFLTGFREWIAML